MKFSISSHPAKIFIGLFAFLISVGSTFAQPRLAALETGTFPETWDQKNVDCDVDAEFQIHAYNHTFHILRQSRCISNQKPFLYLIFGSERALLFDTGAVGDPPQESTVGKTVMALLEDWKTANEVSKYPLTVAHSHNHADHVGGDRYFNNLVDVTVLRLGKKAVSEYFGLVDWPHKPAAFDLGDRVLDVLPIPGHDSASIAIYDRKTGILLTGDSLLPGNIYTDGGLTAVRSSNQRLLDFLADKPVTHVLGGHIDYAAVPFKLAKPALVEHRLQLGRAHLLELQYELDKMEKKVVSTRLRDFRICRTFFYGC